MNDFSFMYYVVYSVLKYFTFIIISFTFFFFLMIRRTVSSNKNICKNIYACNAFRVRILFILFIYFLKIEKH